MYYFIIHLFDMFLDLVVLDFLYVFFYRSYFIYKGQTVPVLVKADICRYLNFDN